MNLTVDSVLIRYLRLGIDDGHLLLMASQDDATAQSVSSLFYVLMVVPHSDRLTAKKLRVKSGVNIVVLSKRLKPF